jgi:hypothetical protein
MIYVYLPPPLVNDYFSLVCVEYVLSSLLSLSFIPSHLKFFLGWIKSGKGKD